MLPFSKRCPVLPFLTISEREVETAAPETRELAASVLRAWEDQEKGESLSGVSRLFLPFYVARSPRGFHAVVDGRAYEKATLQRPCVSDFGKFLLELKSLRGAEDLGEFLSKKRLPGAAQPKLEIDGLLEGDARRDIIQHSRLLAMKEVDPTMILEGSLTAEAAATSATTLDEIEAQCNHELEVVNSLEALLLESAEQYVYHVDQNILDTEHAYSSKLNDLFREVEEAVFKLRHEAREEIDDYTHMLETRVRFVDSRIRSLEKEKFNLTSRLKEEEVRYIDLKKKLVSSDSYHTLEEHSKRVHYDITQAAEKDAKRLKEIDVEKKNLEQERASILEGRDPKVKEITARYDTLVSREEQRIPAYENERDQVLSQLKDQKKVTIEILEEMTGQLAKAREDIRSFMHGELEQFRKEGLPLTLRENTILLPFYIFQYSKNGKIRRIVHFPQVQRKKGFWGGLGRRGVLSSLTPRSVSYEKTLRTGLQVEIDNAGSAEAVLDQIVVNANIVKDTALSKIALMGFNELSREGMISSEMLVKAEAFLTRK